MIEANNIASGNARGISPNAAYINNSDTTPQSSPFPTKSSMYFHRNCISSTKTQMKKVIKNGPKKLLIINLCSRFMLMLA
jgi:hypothetical protein